ncbi:hypothetical protein BDA96_03G152100 [Sorghum bicolor]|uniref:Uncharacterized protein n=2 Tax=Sorghum bicolor TaxID=4558 RepID=A0A921RC33_SORBI|nr:hypothetical protein BDA96_03G152100 [Sorghum bicolor]KXG32369.1 hypothetical protein SORBI_3003G144500 [Sorghum bicolor]
MSRLDTKTLKDELTSMDRRCLLDLGHPLLNRVADSFIRAAGVGAARAVSREAYFVTVEGLSGDSSGLDPDGGKRSHFSSIRGDDGQRSLDAVVCSKRPNTAQSRDFYHPLQLDAKLAAGKNGWQGGLPVGVGSRSLFRAHVRPEGGQGMPRLEEQRNCRCNRWGGGGAHG